VRAPVLAEVDALGPQLRARSAEIEAARSLPVDLVKQLAETGAFKLFVPARYGGAEVSPADGIAVTEALAHADGATGWCQMIAMTTGVLAGYLPAAHAASIYELPSAITGGFAAPVGRATRVQDGLAVSGRWQWGSFTAHCTTIGGGVRLDDGSSRFAYFDRDDVELLDTWYVAGLKGTGSSDYQVHDAFVPEGRWVEVGADAPLEDGPLYRFSFFGLLAIGVAAVALGLARRSIDELVALAGVKTPQGSSRPLSERGATQSDVAVAEARLRAARALVDDVVGTAWDACRHGDPPDDEHRRSIRLAATHATQTAATVVDRMYTTGGGAAIFEDNALQRVFRDVHVATQHAIAAPRTMELVGRLKLGLDTDLRQL
jgi:indole-3-acetate monooxygenase